MATTVKSTLETIIVTDGCPVVTLQTDVVPQRQFPTRKCLMRADLAVDQQGKAVQLRRRFDGIRFLRNRFFVVPAYIRPDEVILDAYVIRDIYTAAVALPITHRAGRLKHDLCACGAGQCPGHFHICVLLDICIHRAVVVVQLPELVAAVFIAELYLQRDTCRYRIFIFGIHLQLHRLDTAAKARPQIALQAAPFAVSVAVLQLPGHAAGGKFLRRPGAGVAVLTVFIGRAAEGGCFRQIEALVDRAALQHLSGCRDSDARLVVVIAAFHGADERSLAHGLGAHQAHQAAGIPAALHCRGGHAAFHLAGLQPAHDAARVALAVYVARRDRRCRLSALVCRFLGLRAVGNGHILDRAAVHHTEQARVGKALFHLQSGNGVIARASGKCASERMLRRADRNPIDAAQVNIRTEIDGLTLKVDSLIDQSGKGLEHLLCGRRFILVVLVLIGNALDGVVERIVIERSLQRRGGKFVCRAVVQCHDLAAVARVHRIPLRKLFQIVRSRIAFPRLRGIECVRHTIRLQRQLRANLHQHGGAAAVKCHLAEQPGVHAILHIRLQFDKYHVICILFRKHRIGLRVLAGLRPPQLPALFKRGRIQLLRHGSGKVIIDICPIYTIRHILIAVGGIGTGCPRFFIVSRLVVPAVVGITLAYHAADGRQPCVRPHIAVEPAVPYLAAALCRDAAHDIAVGCMHRAGNDKVLHRAAGAQHREQALAVCHHAVDIQAGDGMTVAVKCSGERFVILPSINIHADRCPLIWPSLTFGSFWHTIFVQFIQLNVTRQRKIFARIVCTRIDLCRQPCQLRTGADLVGIRLRTSTIGELCCSRAVPDSDRIDRVFALVLQRVDLLGRLLVLIFLVLFIFVGSLVLLIPIGVFFALLILIGLVGVLGVLVLAVLAASGSTHVAAAAIPGVPAGGGASCTSAALDDGRAAVVYHLRGKRRGGHQRQREHYAHQQAHDAPGQIACPFLHVFSPLFVGSIYIKTFQLPLFGITTYSFPVSGSSYTVPFCSKLLEDWMSCSISSALSSSCICSLCRISTRVLLRSTFQFRMTAAINPQANTSITSARFATPAMASTSSVT